MGKKLVIPIIETAFSEMGHDFHRQGGRREAFPKGVEAEILVRIHAKHPKLPPPLLKSFHGDGTEPHFPALQGVGQVPRAQNRSRRGCPIFHGNQGGL